SVATTAIREFRTTESTATLLSGVTNPEPKIRAAAILALRGIKDPRAQIILAKAAGDPITEVRREAVLALGYLKASDTIPVFRAALNDPDDEVRRFAIDALSQFELTDVSDFVRMVADPAWRVRRQAANALAKHPSEAGELILLKSLDDERWEVAREAIVALGKLRTPVSEQLTPFFTHELADMRIAAATAAGEIGEAIFVPRLKALLGDPDTGVQKTATRALRQIESRTNPKA
ncbi:MAG: HEAT repeat domain-containing protein, partial [Verrucomicrobia bacterium]|nr:HEAT repeat domain-containing protein [Verrucomicrobiota bacterium]